MHAVPWWLVRPYRAGVPDFVGRARELALLRAHLADAPAGRGQLALLTGEPGIGKTRLAEELASHAEDAGVGVGWGRASEDEGSPPYWIFRQLIRSTGRPLPELLTGGAAVHGSAQARFEAFEALAEDLRAAGEPGGLLAVLDDLQWADAASLALLVHLARGIGRSRLMIVATYRDTETTGREALSATLSALARESNLTRIRLVGLTPVEVEQQLTVVTRAPVSPGLARLVSQRSGGNPFFVAELGRLLDTTDQALPDAVVDAVRARLARLSPRCQTLIATAAALGDTLDPAVLAEVVERPVAEILADLDEAATAGIVTSAEGWRFGHDLIRESVRQTLPATVRKTLQRQAVDILLESGSTPSDVALQLAESAEPGDELAAETLFNAAKAIGYSSPEVAADLAQKAVELIGPNHPLRAPMVVEAAVLLHAAGRVIEGKRFAETALRSVLPPEENAAVQFSISGMLSISAVVKFGQASSAQTDSIEPIAKNRPWISSTLGVATMAPRRGRGLTRPSDASTRRASRSGVREMPSCAHKSPSGMRVPGGNSSWMIMSRRIAATSSCRLPRTICLRPASGAGFRAFFEGAALSRGAVAVEIRFMPDGLPVVGRMQHRP